MYLWAFHPVLTRQAAHRNVYQESLRWGETISNGYSFSRSAADLPTKLPTLPRY